MEHGGSGPPGRVQQPVREAGAGRGRLAVRASYASWRLCARGPALARWSPDATAPITGADSGVRGIADANQQFQPAGPPVGGVATSPVQRVRLLLSHLGLLTWDPRGFRVAQLNRLSHKLHRDLKSLDKQHGSARARTVAPAPLRPCGLLT